MLEVVAPTVELYCNLESCPKWFKLCDGSCSCQDQGYHSQARSRTSKAGVLPALAVTAQQIVGRPRSAFSLRNFWELHL